MNITTIIELENKEVEELLGARMQFVEEYIQDNIVSACVEGFVDEKTNELISIDDAVEKLFAELQSKKIVSANVEDFSCKLPSCERVKKLGEGKFEPEKVVISYVEEK
ncbi:hypothetical protein [Ectobacillus sp. sgz5001026]|uniref:hypothetical protein n=1 Tax=Ectobacillus sp. sgz5001026 TaxID=3242473 RepID=UPI0036D31A8C